jgi:hypothetical protein
VPSLAEIPYEAILKYEKEKVDATKENPGLAFAAFLGAGAAAVLRFSIKRSVSFFADRTLLIHNKSLHR